jgi:hypothetical protein
LRFYVTIDLPMPRSGLPRKRGQRGTRNGLVDTEYPGQNGVAYEQHGSHTEEYFPDRLWRPVVHCVGHVNNLDSQSDGCSRAATSAVIAILRELRLA